VVATPMPECMGFPEVRIAVAAADLAAALDPARRDGEDPAFRERVRAAARAHTWAERVRTAVAALTARAAVVAAK